MYLKHDYTQRVKTSSFGAKSTLYTYGRKSIHNRNVYGHIFYRHQSSFFFFCQTMKAQIYIAVTIYIPNIILSAWFINSLKTQSSPVR